MDGAPASLKSPADGQARCGHLAPQRSRGDHNSRKRTSFLGKLTRGGLGKPLSRREGLPIWPACGHGTFQLRHLSPTLSPTSWRRGSRKLRLAVPPRRCCPRLTDAPAAFRRIEAFLTHF